MPPITNNTDDMEELESSTAQISDAEVTADKGADAGDDVANSSTATDENDAGLLDVVRDVVKDGREQATSASSAAGEETGQGSGASPSTEPDNENYLDVPFHKHPRFQNLIRERNSLREDAGRYQNVQSYLDQNGLSAEEAANALHTFARAKSDPAGAFAELKPWLQQLLVAAGEVLPDDLKGRVERGELSADAAFELSRERAKSKSFETRQGFEAQRAERQSQVNLVQGLVGTVVAWEGDRRVKDPNFEAKYPALQREVAFLQSTEGKPNTKEGVLEQLKKAYEAVNKTFKVPAAPTRQQQRPAIKPVTGGNVTGNVRQPPKNTLDIVRANRRQAAN